MIKFLYVGDPHVTPDDLEDCEKLIGLVERVALAEGARPVFLGDQHHTHAILHLEVLQFWKNAFARLERAGVWKPIAIVGNHDRPGDPSSTVHAMMAYSGDAVYVIDEPKVVSNILFVPYCHAHDQFIAAANSAPNAPVMVCHQTFDGSQFENGFYAKDGVNPNLLPQEEIISGHIHAPQQVGKVWYPGAPRWRIATDANTERSIWVVTHAEDGRIVEKKPYSTGDTCRQIFHLVDTPDYPIVRHFSPQHDWRIDIHGPAEYVERRAAELAGPSVRVRTFKMEAGVHRVRESDGISVAFDKYWRSYEPRYGTSREKLAEMVKERIHAQA